MASYYIYSGAAGAADGSSWTDAYTTVAAAISGKSAGDIFYIAHDHAESTAGAVTLNVPGTAAAPNQFICVDRAGSVPPVQADVQTRAGSIATTGANAITLGTGWAVWIGLIFSAGDAASQTAFRTTSAGGSHTLRGCKIKLGNTNAASFIGLETGTTGEMRLYNTQLEFGAVGQIVYLNSNNCEWMDTASAIQGSVPTSMFSSANAGATNFICRGVDLSAAGSGKTIVGALPKGAAYLFDGCKLGSSVTLGTTPTSVSAKLDFVNCDSADTNYKMRRYMYGGTSIIETTIVRTGGASDGTTPVSWKLTSTANASKVHPFESFPIRVWNDTVGSSVTVTVEIITDNVTLKDNECWAEARYLGTSGFPLLSKSTNFPGFVDAGTNIPSSSATWTTTGLTTPTKQKIALTFTPQEVGYIEVRVFFAKASNTVYVCPKVTSDTTNDRAAGGVFVNEVSAGSGGGAYIF